MVQSYVLQLLKIPLPVALNCVARRYKFCCPSFFTPLPVVFYADGRRHFRPFWVNFYSACVSFALTERKVDNRPFLRALPWAECFCPCRASSSCPLRQGRCSLGGSGGRVRQLGIGHWACAPQWQDLRWLQVDAGWRPNLLSAQGNTLGNRRMIRFTPCKGKRNIQNVPLLLLQSERIDVGWCSQTVFPVSCSLQEGITGLKKAVHF